METVGKGEAVLKEFIACFEDFKLFANYMRKIFDYVVGHHDPQDRMFYNFNQQNYERLPHRALNMFKDYAFKKTEEIIVQSILLELKKERESCESNRALVNKSLRVSLGFTLIGDCSHGHLKGQYRKARGRLRLEGTY